RLPVLQRRNLALVEGLRIGSVDFDVVIMGGDPQRLLDGRRIGRDGDRAGQQERHRKQRPDKCARGRQRSSLGPHASQLHSNASESFCRGIKGESESYYKPALKVTSM